ncbi:MAG: hypothetical protein QXN08_00055 [Nitrososphaerales archaeon]
MKLRVSLNFYDFEEFIDVEPEAGSCFILSASEPFNEEMEIDFERLSNWLNRLPTTLPHPRFRAHYAHATQRSSKKGSKAKKIYPIHIEHQTYSQSM